MMKRLIAFLVVFCNMQYLLAQQPFGRGEIRVQQVAENAVRIQYTEGEQQEELPDWLYVKHETIKNRNLKVTLDKKHQRLFIKDKSGKTIFTATRHQL